VRPDPRRDVPAADFAAQLAATLELRDLISTVNQAVGQSDDVIRQLAELRQRLVRERAPDSVVTAVRAAHDRLARFRGELTRPTPTFGYRQYPRLREELRSLFSAINGVAARPTDAQELRLGELRDEVHTTQSNLTAALADVEVVNRMLADRPVIITGRRP